MGKSKPKLGRWEDASCLYHTHDTATDGHLCFLLCSSSRTPYGTSSSAARWCWSVGSTYNSTASSFPPPLCNSLYNHRSLASISFYLARSEAAGCMNKAAIVNPLHLHFWALDTRQFNNLNDSTNTRDWHTTQRLL